MNENGAAPAAAPSVSAIVPSYNEGARIRRVLDVLSTYPGFREIIVVDQSGTDETERAVRQYPNVRYLRQTGTDGKGQAMEQSARESSGDVLFFSDADITGLTHAGIEALLAPVLDGTAEMSVVVRGRSVPWLTIALARFFPFATLIGGERAVHRRLWDRVPAKYKRGFRIEHALNSVAAAGGRRIAYHPLPEIRQAVKEQKYGFLTGTARRWRMIREIAATWLDLAADRLRTPSS